jgi:hypothetical protein
VKRLPAGSYDVKLETAAPAQVEAAAAAPGAPPEAPVGQVVSVEAGRTSVLNLPDPNGCIVVGMLEVENANG